MSRIVSAAERTIVILHARTPELGADAKRRLTEGGADPARLHVVAADFASLGEVTGMARQVTMNHPRIDLLVNNAATFASDTRTVTADGHEATFQVNYLAPYLLTRLLWEPLSATAGSKIVNVSSTLHRGGRLHWGDVESTKRYSALAAYAQSKLALTLFTKAAAVRGGTDLIAASVHPGILATDMLHRYSRDAGRPAAEGASAVLQLAGSRIEDGAYYEGVTAAQANVLVNDQSSVDRLWKLSARLVGLAA